MTKHATTAVTPPRDPQAVRKLAALRGMAGTKTAPMDNAERAEHYRRQRGGTTAVAPVLTARQRRRLRKNRVTR